MLGSEKLGIKGAVKAVLIDGTEIDDNDVFLQLKNEIIVIIEKNETGSKALIGTETGKSHLFNLICCYYCTKMYVL